MDLNELRQYKDWNYILIKDGRPIYVSNDEEVMWIKFKEDQDYFNDIVMLNVKEELKGDGRSETKN